MSLYVKIIDDPTGRVVGPLEVWRWDGSHWIDPPEKQILVRIHDLGQDEWLAPSEFRDGEYVFPQRFSATQLRRYEIYHPRYPKLALSVAPGGVTRYVARSQPPQRVDLGSNHVEVRLTPHHLIRFDNRDRFAFGANLAWLDGQYAHDLGPNLLQNYQAYLDANQAATYQDRLANLSRYCRDMHDRFKFRIVRFWVFEGGEGLEFGTGTIRLHETLRANLRKVLEIAASTGIYVYWCLLTSPREHASFARDIEIIRSTRHPNTSPYLNQALRSFCETIRGSSQTFAIDVMNEPEKYVQYGGVSWDEIREFVRCTCQKIKEYLGDSTLVSCGSAGTGWVNTPSITDTMNHYLGLGLDFYDFHIYNDTGELPMTYDQMHRRIRIDRPCIVGEFGQDREGFLDEFQRGVVRNFLEQAWHKGFGGCLVWNYNYPQFPYNDRNTHDRNSLIYRDGSPRPIVGPLSAFGTNYQAYTN